LRSRHERHVRDFDDLPFFDVFLILFTEDPFILAANGKWDKRINPGLARVSERGDLLVLIVLKVAVGRISVVFGRFFVINFFLAEVLRLGLREVPEEHFGVTR